MGQQPLAFALGHRAGEAGRGHGDEGGEKQGADQCHARHDGAVGPGRQPPRDRRPLGVDSHAADRDEGTGARSGSTNCARAWSDQRRSGE